MHYIYLHFRIKSMKTKFEKSILALTLLMSGYILFGSFINLSKLTIADEKYKTLIFVSALFFLLSFTLFLRKAFRLIDSLSKKKQLILSVSLFALQFVIAFLLFANIDYRPNTDSLTDIDTGWFLCKNSIDDTFSHIRWIKTIPNNYLLILIFKGLAGIYNSLGLTSITAYLWVINYLFLFSGIVLTYLCALELSDIGGGYPLANKILLLIVFNPLYYYLTFWVYSSSMSVPILMGICYVLLKLFHEERPIKKCILGFILGVLIVLGYFIRVTSVFPVIAYVLIRVLDYFFAGSKGRKKAGGLLYAALVVAIIFIGIKGLNAVIAGTFSEYQKDNIPITRLIYVGSHGDGTLSTEFEDTGFDYTRLFGQDAETRNKIYIEGTIYNYKKQGVIGTISLWAKKLTITFSDASPAVVSRAFSGTYSGQLLEILKGEIGEIFSNIYRILTMLGIVLCMAGSIFSRDFSDRKLSLFSITLFGEMLFYLVWEVKGDYSLSLMLLMSVLCAVGLSMPLKKASELTDSHIFKAVMLIACLAVSVMLFFVMSTNVKYTHNRINGSTYNRSDDILQIKMDNDDVLRQTFYCSDVFNRITIWAGTEEDTTESSDYQLTLFNEAAQPVFSTTINGSDIKKGTLRINTGDITPEKKNSEYTLEIKRADEASSALTFYTGDNYYIDSYEGTLTRSDVTFVDDLSLKVEYKGEGPYLPVMYIILLLAIMICNYFIITATLYK